MTVRFKLLGLAAALITSPYAVSGQEHAAEGGGGGGLFTINPGLSIWTIVVFLLLLFILGRYAWGPILSAVDAREARIQASLDAAQQKTDEIEALVTEQRAHLTAARQEAQQIVADSREAAERVRKDIEAKARSEGQALVERARAEIDREKEAALESIRRESVDIALAAAAHLVGTRLDADRDRELAISYIASLATEGDGAQA
jgi:F-type H+-transporting ATPase subunit b